MASDKNKHHTPLCKSLAFGNEPYINKNPTYLSFRNPAFILPAQERVQNPSGPPFPAPKHSQT